MAAAGAALSACVGFATSPVRPQDLMTVASVANGLRDGAGLPPAASPAARRRAVQRGGCALSRL